MAALPLRSSGRLALGSPGILDRVAAALLGAWLLAVVGITAPHLVHHAFDEDGGEDCGFLGAVQHGPAVSGHVAPTLPPLPAGDLAAVPRPAVHPLIEPASPTSRGPPAPALATA